LGGGRRGVKNVRIATTEKKKIVNAKKGKENTDDSQPSGTQGKTDPNLRKSLMNRVRRVTKQSKKKT